MAQFDRVRDQIQRGRYQMMSIVGRYAGSLASDISELEGMELIDPFGL
tara:strand:+ start:284 stop:427 length:144 start_codon:yes stop_codon:yes gene_type:complete